MGLVLISVAFLVKNLRGFSYIDEAYYLAGADRIWKGDCFIVDEWHPTQFFFILLTPIYRIIRWFNPSGQGIYLQFRWIAISTAVFICSLLYYQMKKECGTKKAFAAALVVLLYCRGNIPGVKYYDVYVWLLVLFVLLYVRSSESKNHLGLMLSGSMIIFVGCCMPYFTIAIFLFLLLRVIVRRIDVWVRQETRDLLIGMMIAATAIMIYFVIRARGFANIFTNLPYLLLDEGHSEGPLYYVFHVIKDVVHVLSVPGTVLIILTSITVIWNSWRIRLKGSSSINQKFVSLLKIACILGCFIRMGFRFREPNQGYVLFSAYLFPWVVNELIAIGENRDLAKKYGKVFYILGIIGALSFAAGSDVAAQAFSTGMVLTVIGSVCLIDINESLKVDRYLLAVTVVFFLLITYAQRIFVSFTDTPEQLENCRIEQGVLKGIYVTPESKEKYDDLSGLICQLESQHKGDRVYISGWYMWIYPDSSLRCGGTSTYPWPLIPTQKLENYYLLHPENIPEILILDKEGMDDSKDLDLEKYTYRIGDTLSTLYVNKGYEIVESKYAVAYVLD